MAVLVMPEGEIRNSLAAVNWPSLLFAALLTHPWVVG